MAFLYIYISSSRVILFSNAERLSLSCNLFCKMSGSASNIILRFGRKNELLSSHICSSETPSKTNSDLSPHKILKTIAADRQQSTGQTNFLLFSGSSVSLHFSRCTLLTNVKALLPGLRNVSVPGRNIH